MLYRLTLSAPAARVPSLTASVARYNPPAVGVKVNVEAVVTVPAGSANGVPFRVTLQT